MELLPDIDVIGLTFSGFTALLFAPVAILIVIKLIKNLWIK